MTHKISQKGSSLYLTLMIMVMLLAIVFGVNLILLGQIKLVRGMGSSVVALYAADTGIEEVLMKRDNPPIPGIGSAGSPIGMDNGATYYVTVTPKGGSCSAINYCIKSFGSFRGTTRAIEITY